MNEGWCTDIFYYKRCWGLEKWLDLLRCLQVNQGEIILCPKLGYDHDLTWTTLKSVFFVLNMNIEHFQEKGRKGKQVPRRMSMVYFFFPLKNAAMYFMYKSYLEDLNSFRIFS